MESVYLKDAVGVALSKAMTETITAQPLNPQEYLAYQLLHHLQESEYRQDELKRKQRCAFFHYEWLKKEEMKEQLAKKVLTRACVRFKNKLRERKSEDEELENVFDELRGNVDEVLEEVNVQYNQKEDNEEIEEDGTTKTSNLVHKKRRLFNKARASFCRVQCLMSAIQKEHLGQLKMLLVNFPERVKIAQNILESVIDETKLSITTLVERKSIVESEKNISPKEVITKIKQEFKNCCQNRQNEIIPNIFDQTGLATSTEPDISYIVYQLLRCLCYLLYDTTPKATNTAAKIAELIKPTILVKELRAFNPVATYDKNKWLSVYNIIPYEEISNKEDVDKENDDDDNDGDNDHHNQVNNNYRSTNDSRHNNSDYKDRENNGHSYTNNVGQTTLLKKFKANNQTSENENTENILSEPFPVPQPKTRQVRRVQRILRVLDSCMRYYPNISLSDITQFYANTLDHANDSDSDSDEDVKDEEEEFKENDEKNDSFSDYIDNEELLKQLNNVKALLHQRVETRKKLDEFVKRKGGLALWAILHFVNAATQYRVARDAWLDACRQANVELPTSEEMPAEEEEDIFNEEVMYKEDVDVEGEIDEVAVSRLLAKIGTDDNEKLAKLWEFKDDEVRHELHAKLSAYFHQASKNNDNDDDDGDEENDFHDDDDNNNDNNNNNYNNNMNVIKGKNVNQR